MKKGGWGDRMSSLKTYKKRKLKQKRKVGHLIAIFVFFALFFMLSNASLASSQQAADQKDYLKLLQKIADELTKCKEFALIGDWSEARVHLKNAEVLWTEVKPAFLLDENRKGRVNEVEDRFENISCSIDEKDPKRVELETNACIWAMSHQPEGFKVEFTKFSALDWVFALTIGLGYDCFAICWGLHLRRSYRGIRRKNRE
jgi:hypothetical protein